MKPFVIKTTLLMIALLVCVLYGMEVAKHNMLNMVGQTSKQSGVVSQLKEPLPKPTLSGTSDSSAKQTNSTDGNTAVAKKQETTQASSSSDELSERIKKLNTIQTFNPYGSLGQSLSNGLQTSFSHGMTAATSLFNQLIDHVF
ncbi:DUF3679 domain-containing protein [Pullulanibacillus sp. KACC 23026]|uniref:DUF3679 domain-containing protein n=1 Tax=Pullulanibacillus sp. KACC 23026 TaxID=3028315 RepID=UPI0023B1C440|nr:DUF3679 domain-containing protein [Pullulanibacillus sp. KACC 23026]WEG14217.1 DUF3679 domain-containing protein [Pullulanibacillus sp. KACC 23026]